MQVQHQQPRKLLRKANRHWEILVGWACALVSIASAGLLVFLVYVVLWRNPREYGSKDFLDVKVMALFACLLGIALAFSVFASRLLRVGTSKGRLMSPLMLRIWGVFFSAGSLIVFMDCVLNHRWKQLPHLWEILVLSISMGAAAFILARASEKNDRAESPENRIE